MLVLKIKDEMFSSQKGPFKYFLTFILLSISKASKLILYMQYVFYFSEIP